jgi:hypothetical protein
MIYRRGEFDRGWLHQLALPASTCKDVGYMTIHDFCKDLSICPRGHSVFHGSEWCVRRLPDTIIVSTIIGL